MQVWTSGSVILRKLVTSTGRNSDNFYLTKQVGYIEPIKYTRFRDGSRRMKERSLYFFSADEDELSCYCMNCNSQKPPGRNTKWVGNRLISFGFVSYNSRLFSRSLVTIAADGPTRIAVLDGLHRKDVSIANIVMMYARHDVFLRDMYKIKHSFLISYLLDS